MGNINKSSVTTIVTATLCVLGVIGLVTAFSVGGQSNTAMLAHDQIAAAAAVNLSSADNYAVLAGSTITNTGSSVINGDVGLSPGTSVTGFPPGIINGSQHVADVAAGQAQVALTGAYGAAGQTPASTVPSELGGTTKVAGIYDSIDGTFGVTGTLTLDAQGDPNAVFIFKTASTLITAGSSDVLLLNGAQACNVFWQVGSSVTLGTNATFKGNILAMQSITLTTGANLEGSALARNGAVTLDGNIITQATCALPPPAPAPAPIVTPTSTPVVPGVVVTPQAPVVTVVTPQLPNTGIDPNDSNSMLWNVVIPIGALSLILFALYLAQSVPAKTKKND